MTILEKFLAFAAGLPDDRRHAIEELLASVMESDSPVYDLNPEETAEIDRRRSHSGAGNIDEAMFRTKLRKSLG